MAGPPPTDPKAPKDAASAADDWDDMLEGDQKTQGLSPDMARTLLSMNPKLREEGKNTAWVVRQAQQAQQGGGKGAKPQAAQPAGSSTSAPKGGADVFGALDQLQKGFELEAQRIDVEKQKLEEQKKKLEQAQAQLKSKMLQEFTQWLLGKDPELLSPLTQQALSERKAFLDRIGFSVKYFADAKRQFKK